MLAEEVQSMPVWPAQLSPEWCAAVWPSMHVCARARGSMARFAWARCVQLAALMLMFASYGPALAVKCVQGGGLTSEGAVDCVPATVTEDFFYGIIGIINADTLLASGADVNQRGDFGMTPLHYAYMGGNQANIEALLSAGADQTLRCDRGLLPQDGRI
jgi:Ankyrin repeats (many copies)